MINDELYIEKCMELALQGAGYVSPNPMVGAVVLDVHGNLVGEGYHKKYGEAHAEVYALDQAGEKAWGGILYVNLEPCSHTGKTSPCTERIIASGVKTVVTAMVDPNPKVAGSGIQKLQEAGITVKTSILKEKAEQLNEKFIKYITQQQPFIMTKIACTLDGKISTANGSSRWITSSKSRDLVHKLRHEYSSILTTSTTILRDNPHLTCRLSNGKNPIRLILDRKLRTTPDHHVYNQEAQTILFTQANPVTCKPFSSPSCELVYINNTLDQDNFLKEVLSVLPLYTIDSVMVEAGGKLNGSLLKLGLVDKLEFFMAPKIIGEDTAPSFARGFTLKDISETLNLKIVSVQQLDPDLWIRCMIG